MKKGIHQFQLQILRHALDSPDKCLGSDVTSCESLVRRGFAWRDGGLYYLNQAGIDRAKKKADYWIDRDSPLGKGDRSMMEDLA